MSPAARLMPQRNSLAARSVRTVALIGAGTLALAASAKLQVPFWPVPMIGWLMKLLVPAVVVVTPLKLYADSGKPLTRLAPAPPR